MANLSNFDKGVFALQFVLNTVPASATTAMTLPVGGVGFKVPTGFVFQPLALALSADAALAAGTITGYVTADGTALTDGPTAALSSSARSAVGTQRISADPIAAAAVVAVTLVATAGLLPDGVLNVDAVLLGTLTQA